MSFCAEQNKVIGNCLLAFQTLQLSFGYFDHMNCLRLWMLSEIILLFWGANNNMITWIWFPLPIRVQCSLLWYLTWLLEKEIYIDAFWLLSNVHRQITLARYTIFFYYWINKSQHISFDSMVKTSLCMVQDLSHLCTLDLTILIMGVVIVRMSIMINSWMQGNQNGLDRPVQLVGLGIRHVSYLFGHENRLQVSSEGKPD